MRRPYQRERAEQSDAQPQGEEKTLVELHIFFLDDSLKFDNEEKNFC